MRDFYDRVDAAHYVLDEDYPDAAADATDEPATDPLDGCDTGTVGDGGTQAQAAALDGAGDDDSGSPN